MDFGLAILAARFVVKCAFAPVTVLSTAGSYTVAHNPLHDRTYMHTLQSLKTNLITLFHNVVCVMHENVQIVYMFWVL